MSAPTAIPARPKRAVTALTAVAAALSVGICSVVTAGAASAEPALTVRYADDVAGNILHMINAERAHHHLPPLRMNWRLREAAHRHNQLMAAHNELSHQLPGEPSLGDRITATGFPWTFAGENVGWNSVMTIQGVRHLEQVMYDEKPPGEIGHRQNILSRQYRYVGINVRWDKVHHKVWLDEEFARNGG